MGKDVELKDNVFGFHNEPENSRSVDAYDDIEPHLTPAERVSVYSALNALLEAGLDLGGAVAALVREYRRKSQPELRKIKAIEGFFGGVSSGMPAEQVVALASSSFGYAFLQAEECAVLSVLGETKNVGAVLRAAIVIIQAAER